MNDGALVLAVRWMLDLILGDLASGIAVLAIASLGFFALTGRMPLRRAAVSITGCFVIFSSHAIASGLLGAGKLDANDGSDAVIEAPAYVAAVPPAVPYDPYAGASVPTRPLDTSRDLIPR